MVNSRGNLTAFAAGGIVATLIGVGAKLAWDGVIDGLSGSVVWVIVALIVAVCVLIGVVTRTSTKVDHLIEKAAFSIRYYPADAPDTLYQRSREVISQAGSEAQIYAVNSYVEVFRKAAGAGSVESEKDVREQRDYLKQFERKFESVLYHRLIQVETGHFKDNKDNGKYDLATSLAPAYLEHYLEMATFAERNPSKDVKIVKVPAKLPASFVVVKDRNSSGGRIIWQVNMHDPSAPAKEFERIMGVFIITDPDALLVPRFMQWFTELNRGSEEIRVKDLTKREVGSDDDRRPGPAPAEGH
ncbi:hypothetical protein LWC34_15305 [Kibdelosporangium philippinense]|uniref:Uncharacterized protein n=1 Tax=Kibdelosporangium philippinense TaxID=211113 RepID=A0ABS8Z9U9_9PSEU|nr:hypothetical protein [Kibdelosporangium philippinense]MCE7004192.1 hypothetical protein [Kibdelosporangium philippinense]